MQILISFLLTLAFLSVIVAIVVLISIFKDAALLAIAGGFIFCTVWGCIYDYLVEFKKKQTRS